MKKIPDDGFAPPSSECRSEVITILLIEMYNMTKPINMEEIKFVDGEIFKVFIRPPKNRPMGSPQIQRLFEMIRSGAKIVYVPDGVEFIIVKNDGSAKVY